MGMDPCGTFFHAFTASVESNSQQQILEKQLPMIRSEKEYENYFARIYKDKDIKALKEALPSNLKNNKNAFFKMLFFATVDFDFVEGLKHFLDCNMDQNVFYSSNPITLFEGNTPLHIAMKKDIALVKTLLQHKDTDPNIKNAKGKTPLVIALKFYGDPEKIELLLKHGADPNVITKNHLYSSTPPETSYNNLAINESTALFEAIIEIEPEIVKTLILAGADTRVKKEFVVDTVEGQKIKKIFTPYEFASFLEKNFDYEPKKKRRIKIAEILAQTDVLREEARTKKLGRGSLFKGRMYKEMGINRRFPK